MRVLSNYLESGCTLPTEVQGREEGVELGIQILTGIIPTYLLS